MPEVTVVCSDTQQRRADVLAHPTLNGIDFVEVDPADQTRLLVHFLKPVPPNDGGNPADPEDAYGLADDPGRITIGGGSRIVGITVISVERDPDGRLELVTSAAGDFSVYRLSIPVPQLDPVLRHFDFSFKAACPTDVDCRTEQVCPPLETAEPRLDYLARDYASFRRLLLDLTAQRNPNWTERNPSDIGIALVELLAHEGDHLAYFQDAAANEAYLDTVRQRISARRHARLVDYAMHDGRNAWTFLHLTANAAAALPAGTPFVTRIAAPLANQPAPPGVRVDGSLITAEGLRSDPALRDVAVFETTHAAAFDPRNNEIRIHTWGNEECCLPPGIREAYLFHVDPDTGQAERPIFAHGDHLMFEEVSGPATGLPADADPTHRQLLRIDDEPEETEDPIYADTLVDGALQRRGPGDAALPLLRVRWRREDALAFPLCLSARRPDGELLQPVSVARGNVVLADHGLTTREVVELAAPIAGDRAFRLELEDGPLTEHCRPEAVEYAADGTLLTARPDLACDVRAARPAVVLLVDTATDSEVWTPVPHLLDSTPFDQHFVAEVDNRGRAILRFGDGEYGREVAGALGFTAVYRIGNGRSGNVGARSIAHIASNAPVGWLDRVRNPLPATGGEDAETIEQVRRYAPQAFRAKQFRAVTEEDYSAVAAELPEVAGAVAAFRWTGSWYTVFVAIDPADPADLVQPPRGLMRLSQTLERKVRAALNRYRLAGYDIEIRPPRFVPLELDIELCVCRDHFRADVRAAVRDALGDHALPDGRRGFFHPDFFSFGDPLYLSQIYAAVERVEGVDSARVTRFRRWGRPDDGELQSGVLRTGPWEIILLQNDPNALENGVLNLTAFGGKA
jgi:hypothetical protein